jgi:hypothetical protein
MTTRETIERHFDNLAAKSAWRESFADDMVSGAS